jgi:hypothetical protein
MGNASEVDPRPDDGSNDPTGSTSALPPTVLTDLGTDLGDPLAAFESEAPFPVKAQSVPKTPAVVVQPIGGPPVAPTAPVAQPSAAAHAKAGRTPPAADGVPSLASQPAVAARLAPADPRANIPASAVSVARLLEGEVALEWHDAVAIVQELARHVAAEGQPGNIPPVEEIGIESDGRLRASLGPQKSESPVRELGHLLNQLLTDRPVPAALRLLASQAVAEVPSIESLSDLTKRLEQFERPNRQRKLADLHHRGAGAPLRAPRPPAAPTVPPQAQPVPPPPPVEAVKPPERRPTWVDRLRERLTAMLAWVGRRERTRMLAMGTVSLATVIALAVLGRAVMSIDWSTESRLSQPTARPPATQPADTTPATPAESAATLPAAPAATSTTPGTGQTAARPTNSAAGAGSRTPVRNPSTQPSLFAVASSRPDDSRPASTTPPRDSAPDLQVASSVTDAGSTIYSLGDPGVIEPVLIRPYLPQPPRSGALDPAQGVLELIIDEKGAVDSVRLRSPANRYRDRWWVSVAKNWQFAPALKDGRPVKFRVEIPITDFPEPPR